MFPPFIDLLLIFPLALVFGSFTTALIYRIPRNLPWAYSVDKSSGNGVSPYRSNCPHCGHVLGALELIPLLSWVLQKGRCRSCQAAIGAVYPLTELLVLIGILAVYYVYGFGMESLVLMLAVPVLVAMLVIDLQFLILPNGLMATLGLLGFIFCGAEIYEGDLQLSDFAIHRLGGALVFGGLAWALGEGMTRALKKEALGFGDVKFFAVAGLWLGLWALPFFCLIAGVMGIVFGVGWRVCTGRATFPFGPALILSFFILTLLPSDLWKAYLGL